MGVGIDTCLGYGHWTFCRPDPCQRRSTNLKNKANACFIKDVEWHQPKEAGLLTADENDNLHWGHFIVSEHNLIHYIIVDLFMSLSEIGQPHIWLSSFYRRWTLETGDITGAVIDILKNAVMFLKPVCWHHLLSSLGDISGYTIILLHQGKASHSISQERWIYNNKSPQIRRQNSHTFYLRNIIIYLFPLIKNTSLPSASAKSWYSRVIRNCPQSRKRRAEAKFSDLLLERTLPLRQAAKVPQCGESWRPSFDYSYFYLNWEHKRNLRSLRTQD